MLVTASTTVVSLGMSCQTQHQIAEHAGGLAAALGEKSWHQIAGPFDWRIVGPGDVAAMLTENNPYPSDPAELSGDRRRYWKKRNCWFWHDKWDDFSRFTAKQAHLWANWAKVGKSKRQIFLASNTQNNLAAKAVDPGGFEVIVQLEALFALQAALEAIFPAPELHFVTRAPLMAGIEAFGFTAIREREHHVRVKTLAREGVRLHLVAKDRSQWQGDPAAWGAILERIVKTRLSVAA